MAAINNKLVIYYLSLHLFVISATFFVQSSNAATYNVIKFGARPDGKTDSTKAFLNVWSIACNSADASTILVPKGRFLVKAVEFRGPCKSRIMVKIDGTIVAPADYREIGNSSGYWILFVRVDNVSVVGGSLDAKAADFWACRKSKQNCPVGVSTIAFNWANNILISSLTSINSQATHLVILSCNNVSVRNVKLYAPDQSPNTDGIHVQASNNVVISGSTLQTGDDCVSIGPGTRNLLMETIKCGPGHGVSIGSLGKDFEEDGVENVTLKNAAFIGADNGVRIKSWARPSKGFVKNVLFQDIIMNNAGNPIIIDQNYCPYNIDCPGQTSGVKISQITFKNIRGTSRTEEAVKFDCSPSNHCEGISLENIRLTYMNEVAKSSCKHVEGTSVGVLVPESCF